METSAWFAIKTPYHAEFISWAKSKSGFYIRHKGMWFFPWEMQTEVRETADFYFGKCQCAKH